MKANWETVLIDCCDCAVNLDDRDRMERMCMKVAREAGVHPYSTESFWFEEERWGDMHGCSCFTLIVPLQESHLVVHTFPAKRLAIIDITTCGESHLAKAAAHHLAGVFRPTRIVPHYIPRCEEVSVDAG